NRIIEALCKENPNLSLHKNDPSFSSIIINYLYFGRKEAYHTINVLQEKVTHLTTHNRFIVEDIHALREMEHENHSLRMEHGSLELCLNNSHREKSRLRKKINTLKTLVHTYKSLLNKPQDNNGNVIIQPLQDHNFNTYTASINTKSKAMTSSMI